MITIMATMSGYQGYRAIGDFAQRYKKEIVKVSRTTHFKNSDKVSIEISYYISSKKIPAKEYNKGIRAHWRVEAMHYVKDVTFGEDASETIQNFVSSNF